VRSAAEACVLVARVQGEPEARVDLVERTRSHQCDTRDCGSVVREPTVLVRLAVSGLDRPLTREVAL